MRKESADDHAILKKGNNYIEVILPAESHVMPFQEQKVTSLSHPTFCKVEFAVACATSLSAQNWRAAPWPVVWGLLVVAARSLGTADMIGAQVPHGYESGFDGALSLNCDRQSRRACDGGAVVEAAGADVDVLVGAEAEDDAGFVVVSCTTLPGCKTRTLMKMALARRRMSNIMSNQSHILLFRFFSLTTVCS